MRHIAGIERLLLQANPILRRTYELEWLVSTSVSPAQRSLRPKVSELLLAAMK
jgi:hypothetical protein